MSSIKGKNFFRHFKTVSKHKWLVFKFCVKLGMPIRGISHDMSKFSPVEFLESVKYYDGHKSPIGNCKKDIGYSKAWLHHKGRNTHHYQYWLDFGTDEVAIVMPYKDAVEMICDKLSASITYNGDNWTWASQYEYWQKEKKTSIINPKIVNLLDEVFLEVKENGIDKTLTKANIKGLYKKYCIDDKTKYKYVCQGSWVDLNDENENELKNVKPSLEKSSKVNEKDEQDNVKDDDEMVAENLKVLENINNELKNELDDLNNKINELEKTNEEEVKDE